MSGASVAVLGLIAGIGGAVLGAHLTNQGARDQQVASLRLGAYATYLAASNEYQQTQYLIAKSMPEPCLRLAEKNKMGGSECRVAQPLVERLRSAVSERYLATRELDLVGSVGAIEAATRVEHGFAHYFNGNTALVAVAPTVASYELDRRGLEHMDYDRVHLEDAALKVMSCDVSGRYVVHEGAAAISSEPC